MYEIEKVKQALRFAMMGLENTNKEKLKSKIIDSLKLPRNYKKRINGQIKRYENKKTVEEVRDILVEDWIIYENTLDKIITGLAKITNEVFSIYINTLEDAKTTLYRTETKIEIINCTYKDKLKMTYMEFKKNLVKEYIEMGVSPDKAIEIVVDNSYSAEKMELTKLFDKSYAKYTNEYY